jgi:hypothetical protein
MPQVLHNKNSGCFNSDKFARIGSYAAVHMPQVLHEWRKLEFVEPKLEVVLNVPWHTG